MALDLTKITSRGKWQINLCMVGGVTDPEIPKWIDWGTGSTPATVSDTGLETPATENRVEGTVTQQTTFTTNDTYRVVGTLTCDANSKNIREIGLFTASTGGIMLLRSTFDTVAVVENDTITVQINIVVTRGV